MQVIKDLMLSTFSSQHDYVLALKSLNRFLEESAFSPKEIEFTPYRLAEIFSEHVKDENSISLLINRLCSSKPRLLVPNYYFEHHDEVVDLDESEVYSYLFKGYSVSPVTGESLEDAKDHIFVVYYLSSEALSND
ncbi:hypothetical protein KZO85_12640 [Chromohalobacter canadensis]|uniref:hypothetical protein n=1 Tax=Chromohalobacter canadensis TaxID=141389 RepID=UPI0021BECD06|nr:hypothetical protein [Chromohalobacter canadensis]MCT8469433.1 hypothetical protein [Chromohalobacter canadensis]MCT8472057.1 hypothetical protein [Chromohalobacter canadensis]MCT8499830.1 hypothetical protein [Chromohalobacter canadensis]